jgi:protein SCO1/2
MSETVVMKKPFYIVMLLIAVCGLGVQAWYHLLRPQPEPLSSQSLTEDGKMRRFSTVPDFAFTNRDGKQITLDAMKGKVWLANFIYTTCPSTCPMLSSRFSSLQDAAFALDENVRMVSFSVDPENDTPAVMEEYANALGAKSKWYFLTGGDEQLRKVAIEGFLMGYQKVPDKVDDIIHSTKIALVDREGKVRRFYDGVEKDESQQILADLKTLLQEQP